MKSLYKSAEGKRAVLDLYDEQLSRIGCPFEDVYVDTAFGRTHVVVTGDPEAVPLLSFHGGNSTTAHNLITSPPPAARRLPRARGGHHRPPRQKR